MKPSPLPRRGTLENPPNRFEPLRLDLLTADEDGPDDYDDEAAPPEPTTFFVDASRSILAENESPDLGFRYSLNPYRGCEHGCIYCYARPSHQYLGFSAGLDFERRVLVKQECAALLRSALASPRWQPEVIALSGNTDCYQPVERRLGLTRQCLGVLAAARNPTAIITKSALVTRDIDFLEELAAASAVRVYLSITSLDPRLARRLEPRAARPERRLDAIRSLAQAGIPVGVMVAPVIPGLNDHEIPRILGAAADAGAQFASWVMLRLAKPIDQLFDTWLTQQFPERRARVLGHIREVRGGALNDTRFGIRQRGVGPYAEQIAALFRAAARKTGLDRPQPALSSAGFQRPRTDCGQLALF